MDIYNNNFYVCWKDNNKLYFSKKTGLAWTEPKLISKNITGIPYIKINNEHINVLVSKNNNPTIFKSVDNGINWIEKNDISNQNLNCVNNPSYGIAQPLLINADKQKIIAAYASPELTIQTSLDNAVTWSEPEIITNVSVLNGFSVYYENGKLIYSWAENSEYKTTQKNIQTFAVSVDTGTGAALNLNNVVVYPNPFKPSESVNGYITFENVTSNIEIKIYTIAGELVDEKNLTGTTGKVKWDCKNKSGEYVSSGVYLYIIKNDKGEKKTGKIAVIR